MSETGGDVSANDELTWNDLTVPQLKEELTLRGLETTGKKAELIARLEQYDKEMAAQQKQEDENGDEFVVWNADEEMEPDGEITSEGAKKDDDKVDDADIAPESEDRANEKTDDGDVKATEEEKQSKEPDPEYSTSTSKDKDLLYLMFSGRKIIIPFKEEVLRDLKHASKQQNIIMYPVQVVDLFSDTIRPLIEKAINVSTELDETLPGQTIKGYLRLKFGTATEASQAIETLKEYRRDGHELTIKHFADDDSEGHVLSKIKKEESERRGPLVTRLVYVGNLPSEATEESIKSCFTDAVRVILPSKEDSSEKLGHAYLEYGTEADASEAAKKYKTVELAGQKLYVIKSLTVRAESFGLLKDGLRKYWLEQIHSLEATKAKSQGKSTREIEALDVKLLRMKRRIKNDNDKREILALPILESEIVEVPEGAEDDKPKDDKPAERSHSSHGDSKSSDRRRTPPRRRYSPPPFRGRSSSRGFRGGPSGSYGRNPGADRLVDQLQEIVGALAHRTDYGSSYRGRGGYDVPSRGSRGGYSSDYRGDYREPAGRFGVKRPGDDYGGDRKRHETDSYYRGAGRGGFDRRDFKPYGQFASTKKFGMIASGFSK